MAKIEEKLLELLQEEEKHREKFSLAYRVETVLSKLEDNFCLITYLVLAVTLSIVFYIYSNEPFFANLLQALFLAWFPGFFVWYLLYALLEKPIRILTFRYYKLTEAELTALKNKQADLNAQRWNLDNELQKNRERDFVELLANTIEKVKKKALNIEEAKSMQAFLEKENAEIRNTGYKKNYESYYVRELNILSYTINSYNDKDDGTKASSAIAQKETIIIAKAEETLSTESPANPPIKKSPTNTVSPTVANNDKSSNSVIEFTPSELFEDSSPTPNSTGTERKPIERKIDYQQLNALRQQIGSLGEEFVLKIEIEKLKAKKLNGYAAKVQHIAKTSDAAGYDIISFLDDGSPKYIEVKTTTDDYRSSFFISERELSAMKSLENYFVYRVFNFNLQTGKGQYYVIDCRKDIRKFYNFEPTGYKVSPK